MIAKIAALCLLFTIVTAEVYFQETFNDDGWESRWVKSMHKEAEGSAGKWEISHGNYYRDAVEDRGLKTGQDARFYQISAAHPEFSNKGKDLVVQFSVKHEQKIDCGGGYLKLLPEGLDQTAFNGDSNYNIMFGPDICGTSTKRTHVIFNYKGKNHLVKKDVKCETDEFTHLYTLVVHPDNTYEVLIDQKSVQKGNLKEDFDFLAPKEIPDPSAKKPADWVDEPTMVDPTDKKPEGWDDIPAQIADPDAKKPDDWDDELDGEWEAPMIDNPEYKGEWKANRIPNPAYKGEWVHPKVPNPDFVDDDSIYAYNSFKYVGIEIWQVKAGTIFDNIILTDSLEEANKLGEITMKLKEAEQKKFKEAEEERKRKEEEERKNAEAAESEDQDEEKPAKDEL